MDLSTRFELRVPFLLVSLGVTLACFRSACGADVRFGMADLLFVATFWAVLGMGLGAIARTVARRWAFFANRPGALWALCTATWALLEVGFTAIVVVKPTRLVPEALISVLAALALAAAVSLAALVAAIRNRNATRWPTRAIVVATFVVVGTTTWFTVWIRAYSRGGAEWLAWGAIDVAWLAACAVAAVMATQVVEARRPRLWHGVVAAVSLGISCSSFLVGGPENANISGNRRPIIWIVVDSVRADHTSLAGYRRDTTPALAAVAEDGTIFERHIANGVATEYTFGHLFQTSVVSGEVEQPVAGPLSSVRHLLPPATASGRESLLAAIRRQGYYAAFFSAYPDLLDEKGLRPWLEQYDYVMPMVRLGDGSIGNYFIRLIGGAAVDNIPPVGRWNSARRAKHASYAASAATAWLAKQQAGAQLFAVVHLAGSHEPFYVSQNPTPYLGMPLGKRNRLIERILRSNAKDANAAIVHDAYDEAIRESDEQLARVIEQARRLDAQIFVFADHGYALPGDTGVANEHLVPLVMLPSIGVPRSKRLTSSGDVALTTVAVARGEGPRCSEPRMVDLRCSDTETPMRRLTTQVGAQTLRLFESDEQGLTLLASDERTLSNAFCLRASEIKKHVSFSWFELPVARKMTKLLKSCGNAP